MPAVDPRSTVRRLRPSVRVLPDGLRSSGPVDQIVPPDGWPRDADISGSPHGRSGQVRHRMCQLPSHPVAQRAGTPAAAKTCLISRLEISGAEAIQLASARTAPGRTAGCPVRRLPRPLSALRDGFRSSRSGHQDLRSHADGGPCRPRPDIGRGGKVRYRLCELSPRSDIRLAHTAQRAGVAQLVERQPSKL